MTREPLTPLLFMVNRQEIAPLGMRPALDGVRALAIVPVLLYHSEFARQFQSGRAGVDLFFVLSGFLITNLLLEERDRTGSLNLRNFYIRRALRLGPAMLCVLAFAWGAALAEGGLGTTPHDMARYSVFVLTYTNNWASAFSSSTVPGPLGHFWSLAVEEQFYLLWPFVLLAAFRRNVSLRTLLITLLLTVAALALWRTILWRLTHDPFRTVFGTDTRAGGLLFGAALAAMRHMGARISRRFSWFLTGAGLILYLYLIPQPYDLDGRLILGGLQPVEFAAGLIIVGLTASPSVPFKAVFESPLALWLGRRSYAIYLWNWPLVLIVRRVTPGAPLMSLALGVACTFVAAELSFRYVERPVLLMRRELTRLRPQRPLSAAA